MNVEELGTRTYSALDSGGMLFEAKRGRLPVIGGSFEVREQLEQIAQDMMVEIRLLIGSSPAKVRF